MKDGDCTFNRASFNRIGFNQSMDLFVTLNSYLQGVGIMQAIPRVELTSNTVLAGLGSLTFTISQGGSSMLSGIGNIQSVFEREIQFSLDLLGVGNISASANRFTVSTLVFSGNFEPGDTIIIDSNKFIAKINGIDALSDFDGDFMNLKPGINKITYSDQESTRAVEIIIRHKDRWL